MYTFIKALFTQLKIIYSFFKPATYSLNRIGLLLSLVLTVFAFGAKSQTVSMNVVSLSGNFCAPSSIKFTPVFSIPPLNFIWDFGIISDFYNQDTPTITYTVPGTYQVKLTALYQNKIVEAVQSITIYGLPNFTVMPDKNYICQPGDIVFTAKAGEPIASYSWNFGDGTPQLNQPSAIISHGYAAYGNYTTTVMAITKEGCVSRESISILVNKPTASLMASPKTGCLPANTSFQANVLVPTGSSVSTYTWNFGDGTPEVTHISNQVNHIYTISSGVKPQLSITTNEGCTNTFTFDSLYFGHPPQPVVMSADSPTICFSETGVLRAYAIGANSYRWDFGTNDSFITTDTVIFHKFADIKNYKVKVTASFNGCQSATDSLNFNVVGVKADFGYQNRCTEKSTFDFYPYFSANITDYLWDFGDSSLKSGLYLPTHTFPGVGTYSTTLMVYDSLTNCRDVSVRLAYVTNPSLVPTDSFVCRNSAITLKVENASDAPSLAFLNTFLGETSWAYGPANNAITRYADSSGTFSNRVIVYIGNGANCPDTLVQKYIVRVGGPTSDFDSPAFLCISNEMVVQNKSSTYFPYDTITNWAWNFGNGINTDIKANPTPFEYSKPGKYWVSLQTTDKNGCIDSIRKQTVVNHLPFIAVSPSSGLICPGDTILLNALHQGQIRWSPASAISCDSCSIVNVNPIISTRYTATVADTIGCSSTFSVNINVHTPYNFSHSLRDTGFCMNSSVQLDVGLNNLVYHWSPATGLSNPNIRNPIAMPAGNTIYRVDVIDSAGCFPNSAQAAVLLHPLPLIDPGPTVMVPYNSPFDLIPIYGADIVSYIWNPVTQLNCITCPHPSGIALESFKYTVTATTSKGCTASATIQLFIACNANNILMPNAFTPNNDNLNEYFYPITRGIDLIGKFIIYNRYGQVVFQRFNFKPNEKNSGWNGTINSNPPLSGSYIYHLEAICNMGEVIYKKGSVMLIR